MNDLSLVFEPLLAELAKGLECDYLAFWSLHVDGRHFLEEEPSGELPQGTGEVGSPGPDNTSPADPYLELAEVVDASETPFLTLVLESSYPERIPPTVTSTRVVPADSVLYTLLDPTEPNVRRVRFPPTPQSVPEPLMDREGWVCRLEIPGRMVGAVGLSGETSKDAATRFEAIWKDVRWKWERLQLMASLRRRTQTLRAVQAVGDTITSQLDIRSILQAVVELTTVLMRAKISSLMLVDDTRRELVLESVYGSSPDYLLKPNLDIDRSLLGLVVRSGRPLTVPDVRNCQAYAHRDMARSEGLVSLLSVPLNWKDHCMGVLNVYSPSRYRYTRDDVYILSTLASQSAIAIQNARSLQRSKSLENQIHELDKLSMVGELASGVAHEIRNPLAAVRMLVETWEPVDPGQAQDLEVISTQLEGINRCVTQLLEMSRPLPPEFSSVDLSQEIANTLQLLRIRLRDQEIRTELDLAEAIPPVRTDASRFRQLLMNLLLNSLSAMPESGKLHILLEECSPERFARLPGVEIVSSNVLAGLLEPGSSTVLLTLADTGGGLQVEDLRAMFEPFHRSSTKGFGLGLSVVKRLAQEHQSPLKVRNMPGEGLTFHLLFPAS